MTLRPSAPAIDPITPPVRPWWREPYVWLVLSGPLSVVAACIATAVVIARHPEHVIDEDYYQHGLEINKTLAAEAAAKHLAQQPATLVRNHAATVVLHGGKQ